MKEWPKDTTKTAYFEDLADPIVKALKFVIRNKGVRIADDVVIPYKGYNIGKDDLACCFDPVEKLSTERRNYDRDNQGRDIYDLLVSLAIQLGIEQGRRILRSTMGMDHMLVKLDRIEDAIKKGQKERALEQLEDIKITLWFQTGNQKEIDRLRES